MATFLPFVDSERDEIDLMAPTIPKVFFADGPLKIQQEQRALRPRQSLGNAVSQRANRKRTLSMSANENNVEGVTAKKAKVDEKKAITAVLNVRRDTRDVARNIWFYRHRHIVEPLLPPSSKFFDNLQKEVEASKDRPPYVPLHELDEQPKFVKGGDMKDYQIQGLSFLVWMYNNGMNAILGDEMGLGKTLQTLSLFAYIKQNVKGPHDPHLVICPLSVLSSWQAEATRWLPSFNTIRFHGPVAERERLKNELRGNHKFDVIITTYESYIAEESWFKSRRWMYCVLDEGHKIKNSEINLSRKVQTLGSLFRLILTGTPVQNNLVELWSLLHWLYPLVFTPATERLFKDSFDINRGTYNIPFLTAAKKLVSTIMLRRTKAVVEADVPCREELTVFIPLTEAQRFWTYRLLTRMDTLDLNQIFSKDIKVEEGAASEGRREVFSHLVNQMQDVKSGIRGAGRWKKLMNLLMQLRQVCDHPYLLPNAEPTPYSLGEHVVAASSKLIAIDKLLADILPKGERVLIFSQWTGMLDLLEDFMALRSIPYARLDGSTSRPRRALDIKLFQQEASPYSVFLVSTKAGGLGINLTKASTVIMCDSDWNPQNDLQAIARAHRIGQTKIVKVFRLICHGSVEDQMLDRIRRKLFLSVKIMGSDNPTTSENTSLSSNELIDILRKGSSALTRSNGGMDLPRFLDANLTEILDFSRSREGARDAKMEHDLIAGIKEDATVDGTLLQDAEKAEQELLSGVAQVRCRLFEGKMVHRVQNNQQIATEWEELQKRTRVDRTVMVDGMPFILPQSEFDVIPAAVVAPKTKTKAKFGSEEWCIHCRDGGELVLCHACPRVFHASCAGVSKAEVRNRMVACSQHSCTDCQRSTSQSGGMLFRCRTCPQAFCEDCLPPGEIDAVGDVLPEFELLGYGQKNSAYFIRCHDCRKLFTEQPELWQDWENEIRNAQRRIELMHA